MDKFYGFDLGDAESAVSLLSEEIPDIPEILSVNGDKSFITAYALTPAGELMIGEKACFEPQVIKRKLRFKSTFLTSEGSRKDIASFAAGVLGALYEQGNIIPGEDSCFYVGCPAGWDANTRELYRDIFERASYPPVRIISESRAAMVSACQSRYLQVGYNILSRPVLVVDIGSSTTDFAYVFGGKEVQMQTAGEVKLGGGIMDETLLERSVAMCDEPERIREIIDASEPWKNYCEFTARRVKERYFSDPSFWLDKPCMESIMIQYDRPARLTIRMDEQAAEALVETPVASLGGASFHSAFTESLRQVAANISGQQPELIFLTGGVSKHPLIRSWCISQFPDAVVITGTEPEFSVTRGLAWSGRIDEHLRQFKKELDLLISSSTVENIVREHIAQLYSKVVDALVKPLLMEAALPVFDRWREGAIRRLADTDEAMQEAITQYLKSEEARSLLAEPITSWLRPVSDALEEHTMPICIRHDVPYTALSLNSYLSAADMDVRIDAKDVFAVEEITWLIDSVISIVVGLLCGGSGVALITGGPTGILAGAAASLLVLALGKDKMESALLKADLPTPIRKLVPKHAFESRMESLSGSVRDKLYESLHYDKNEEITARMADEIALQIEQCLLKMAEVVEIPLG